MSGMCILAQRQSAPWEDILFWSAMLAVAVFAGLVIAVVARRMLHKGGETVGDDFTLHGLRSLLNEGRITPEEFERAKAGIIARARAAPEGVEEDPAERAVRELRERRHPADKPHRQDASNARESQDEGGGRG